MPMTPAKPIGKPLLLVIVSISILNPGCQSFKSPSVFSRLAVPAPADKVAFHQPHRMAAIWKETVVSARPGHKGTRGFGGRVYFYGASNEPVRVDGELVVYAFDDSKTNSENPARVPDRKYVFRASDFQKHFSQTNIGASYSVWIPWDEIGGQLTTVSLLPVFKPVDGTVIQAGQSIAILPGKEAQDTNKVDVQRASIGVRQASASLPDGVDSHVARAGGTSEARQRRRTTTIDVPRGLGNQLKQLNQVRPATVPQAAPPIPPMIAPAGAAAAPVPDSGNRAAHPLIGDSREMELDPLQQKLYERLRAENDQTMNTGGKPKKRPVVFGSPGPVR